MSYAAVQHCRRLALPVNDARGLPDVHEWLHRCNTWTEPLSLYWRPDHDELFPLVAALKEVGTRTVQHQGSRTENDEPTLYGLLRIL